jgi:hypothetical protein
MRSAVFLASWSMLRPPCSGPLGGDHSQEPPCDEPVSRRQPDDPDQLIKNSWFAAVIAGSPVKVATRCEVPPLPSVLENSSPLVVS